MRSAAATQQPFVNAFLVVGVLAFQTPHKLPLTDQCQANRTSAARMRHFMHREDAVQGLWVEALNVDLLALSEADSS